MKLIHFNDTNVQFGSMKDLHEKPFYGKLEKYLERIVNNANSNSS